MVPSQQLQCSEAVQEKLGRHWGDIFQVFYSLTAALGWPQHVVLPNHCGLREKAFFGVFTSLEMDKVVLGQLPLPVLLLAECTHGK